MTWKLIDTSVAGVCRINPRIFLHPALCRTIWRINEAKGHATESLRLYYPSGRLCHEREVLEFKQFAPDVWMPVRAVYNGYTSTGALQIHTDYKVARGEVNSSKIDPVLFKNEIPPDAEIHHEDAKTRR